MAMPTRINNYRRGMVNNGIGLPAATEKMMLTDDGSFGQYWLVIVTRLVMNRGSDRGCSTLTDII